MMVSDILTEALVYLSDPKMWLQGAMFDKDKRCCIVGALHLVAYDGHIMAPASYQTEIHKRWAYRFLEEAVDPGNRNTVDVEDWNDRAGRSHRDILEALQTAIHLAMEAGA